MVLASESLFKVKELNTAADRFSNVMFIVVVYL